MLTASLAVTFGAEGHQSNRTLSPLKAFFYLLNHGYVHNFACCYLSVMLQHSKLRELIYLFWILAPSLCCSHGSGSPQI